MYGVPLTFKDDIVAFLTPNPKVRLADVHTCYGTSLYLSHVIPLLRPTISLIARYNDCANPKRLGLGDMSKRNMR